MASLGRTIVLLFCTALAFSTSFAQEYSIQGKVLGESKSPLPGVLVRLVNSADTSHFYYAETSRDGVFLFARIPPGSFRLEATAVGRRMFSTTVRLSEKDVDVGNLVMEETPIMMREVLIQGRVPPAIQHGDTTEYRAAAVKVNRDATAEDLLTKMPGITVTNGTITHGGETVQRVLVDGRPFFGDDPTLAVRNLPAEVIDKIQVFDQMSDQAQFTGFDDGQSIKTLNIMTRRNRQNMNFGKIVSGYGDKQRYDAAGNVNLFNGNSRMSFLGSSNNVNQQDFSTQDFLGIISSNNQVRMPGAGFGRGGNGGRARRGSPFGRSGGVSSGPRLVGQQQGINTTSMLGTNMSDSLASDLFAQGSYFFNRVNNQNQQLDHRQYLLGGDSTSLYDQNSDMSSRNFNHRINSRIDYAVDPSNSITFLPILYFQSNRADNLLNALTTESSGGLSAAGRPSETLGSQSQTNTNALNSGYNLSGHVVYRHKFDVPGRTMSLDIGVGANRKQTNGLLASWDQLTGGGLPQSDTLAQQSDYLSNVHTFSANLVYTEPTGENGLFQVLYAPLFTRSTADKRTYDFDEATQAYTNLNIPLSNSYTTDYITQNAGIGYRWRGTGLNLMTTLSYQVAELRSDETSVVGGDISRRFGTFMPSALVLYTMPDHRNLRVFYRTFTRSPSVAQLQHVTDNSNPLLLSTGNPDLVQSYSHTLLARYSLTAPDQARSMFLLLSGTYTLHYIANASIIPARDTLLSDGTTLAQGTQLTYPVNLNGYWNVRSFFTYGLPFDLLSSTLNLNSGITFARTPGLVNNVLSVSNSISPSLGFVVGSNISEDFDFTISYAGNYTIGRNSIQPSTNSNYYSHTASLKWVWTFWKGIVLNNQLSNVVTSGLAQGFDQNIMLWNVGLAKKFFADDKGELKVGVADLLGQNKSVNRLLTSSYVDDTQNEVLTRYFLLSFTYTIR
jgi:hypothetical protein